MDTRQRFLAVAAVAAVGSVPLLSGCASDDGDAASNTTSSSAVVETGGQTSAPETSQPSSPSGKNVDLASVRVAVDWRQALDAAGKTFSGQPVTIKLKRQIGAPKYQVTLLSQSQEAEIDVNANTGEVIDTEIDDLDSDDDRAETLDLDGVIEPDVAMTAATKALSGPVTEWKLTRDGGRLVYEVEIDNPEDDGEVTLDAKTGEVLEVDR